MECSIQNSQRSEAALFKSNLYFEDHYIDDFRCLLGSQNDCSVTFWYENSHTITSRCCHNSHEALHVFQHSIQNNGCSGTRFYRNLWHLNCNPATLNWITFIIYNNDNNEVLINSEPPVYFRARRAVQKNEKIALKLGQYK